MAFSGRENPVTRPTVFRTQDAQSSLSGVEVGSSSPFPLHYAHQFSHSSPSAAAAAAAATNSNGSADRTGSVAHLLLPSPASGSALARSSFIDPFASSDAMSRPFTNAAGVDSFNGFPRTGSPSSPALGAEGLPRNPSVRTFSQLSAVPTTSPTSAFYPADGGFPGWAEYNRTLPLNPSEPLNGGSINAEALLQRPLGPDTLREAVYAYLEATDKHDVVMAMLADERRHSQRSAVGAATATAAGASPRPSPSPSAAVLQPVEVSSASAEDVSAARRADLRSRLAGTVGSAESPSVPSSTSLGHSGITSLSNISANASHPLSPPPRDAAAAAAAHAYAQLPSTSSAAAGAGAEGRRGRQRRSHDLLRKGLLDRRASGRLSSPADGVTGGLSGGGGGGFTEEGKAAVPGTSRRPPISNGTPELFSRPSSPGVQSSQGRSASPAAGKPPPMTQRQHLPRVLPTLCGLEEAVRPDLILLFADLETKILEQYRQLRVPPPSHEVLQYILTQAYEPMWSVGEDANVYHLFQPTNPVTGMVLYGTLNQMVEQLTQVHVMPLSTPPEMILKSGRSFCQAFLRRHRLLMPSHVLLAKLMERYLVPLSLRLGFERFKVHGITVHIPGMGASLPPRRSQSETVLHGRRHPGAAGTGAGVGGNTANASTTVNAMQGGGLASAEAGVWGSRSAPQAPATSGEANGLSPSTSAAVEEYVRATAAATSPDAALIAMVRSGMFPNVTNDSIAALTSAAIGTVPGSTLTSNPASTTLPHRNALGGFPNGHGATGGGTGLSGFLSGASRPAAELVTSYSPSAALWLTVCERVQLKVLSVLLYWLQHHPHHFDGEMLRSVLHFVESCCYGTCEWADAPSRQPQIAEFIRQACHAAVPLSTRRPTTSMSPTTMAAASGVATAAAAVGGLGAAAQFAAYPPISKEWRDGVLSGTWERRRYQLLSEAIPPSLRNSDVKAELLPWTWITPMGSLTPSQYLPCFAFRALPSAEGMMSYPGEERQQHFYHSGHHRSVSGGATTAQAASDVRTGAADVTRLHAVAQEALRLFGGCTFETYVRGLTAAHYRMFTAFPSQDIFIAAQHTSSSYLSSPAFQSSFLGLFLNSSAFLTSWCVSLLLHAAYLDGERAAAAVAVTNLSILNSFVGDMTDYRAQAASEAEGDGGGGGGGGSAGHSRSSSLSLGNSSLSTASAATASAAAASQSGGAAAGTTAQEDGDTSTPAAAAAAAAVAAGRRNPFPHNPARQFLHILDRLVDLVVGFLRVNNLHASYSIFRGFQHPFVQKLRLHHRISAHTHAQTAHRIRKLEGFFTSIPPSSAARGGKDSHNNGTAARQPSTSAAAAADVGDPPGGEDDLDLRSPRGDKSDRAAAAPASDGTPRKSRKPHHSFFEYLNTVPDSVEYPTVPVVQYYLRELQMMFALEPTFFTVPTHQMQSRFVCEEVRLTGLFTVPSSSVEEEQMPTAASPIAVVNWRKMHLVDDWIQRVNSNQMSCLHYISSRSTVVRNIVPDLEFEKTFDEQLGRVVVTNTTLLQEMANQLYNAL